jgi:hypothetical protein
MQVADMASDESDVLTGNVSDFSVGHFRDRSDPAAATFAVHEPILTNATDGM